LSKDCKSRWVSRRTLAPAAWPGLARAMTARRLRSLGSFPEPHEGAARPVTRTGGVRPCVPAAPSAASVAARVAHMSELRVILALVVANGIFAGSEIAVVALRRSRIQELADEGGGRARAVLKLRDHPERFLATVQVGITVVSLCLTAAGKVPSAG